MNSRQLSGVRIWGGRSMDVLDRIDELRKERGWSINNLAMEAMITQSTLNNLYARHSEPKLSTLRTICQAFGITLAEFFSEDDGDKQHGGEDKEELIRRINALSDEQSKALIVLLRSIR